MRFLSANSVAVSVSRDGDWTNGRAASRSRDRPLLLIATETMADQWLVPAAHTGTGSLDLSCLEQGSIQLTDLEVNCWKLYKTRLSASMSSSINIEGRFSFLSL